MKLNLEELGLIEYLAKGYLFKFGHLEDERVESVKQLKHRIIEENNRIIDAIQKKDGLNVKEV